MNNCANCKNWTYDPKNRLDAQHEEQGRRRCAADQTMLGIGKYVHGTMPACKEWQPNERT